MALNSTSSLNGFVRNSTAPAFIAWTSLRNIAVARNENDRHVRPFNGDLFLQVETVETRKRNVQHKAAGNQGSRAGKEF
jgi:hypothetical protein